MEPIVELKDVSAGYNDEWVLKDVNLKVFKNDFIGIIGPNGGGKTTLLKLILGILKPWKGRVIKNLDKADKSIIGYLPQITATDSKFPIQVTDVVLSGLMSRKTWFGRYSKEDKQKALAVMERIGVDHLKHNSFGELSGGQKQRILLCRAIISSPELLVLDEPSTYVDNKFEGELYELLRKLNKEMAIIMVSHDLGIITPYIKSIGCVNRNFHYHKSNKITEAQLAAYNCPIQLITHGTIPHTVLKKHS